MLSPLTTTLNYGTFDPDGGLDVRVTYDHRVFDGGTAARATADLESALRTVLLTELQAGPGQARPRTVEPTVAPIAA